MPPIDVFFGTWSFDPWAFGLLVAAGGLYTWGLVRAARAGVRWPLWRVAAFFLLGLGVYAFVNFGFLGTYSPQLRYAFSIRIVVMLFVVPAGLALGLPAALAKAALPQGRVRAALAAAARWPMKAFSNSAIAPVVGLLVLSMFLTPLAGFARLSPLAEGLLSVGIPLLGLMMVLPMVEMEGRVSTAMIMVQFVFAFIELLADAVPGIILRLTSTIYDGVGAVSGAVPPWFPNTLRDQQLAGDYLWFIAEIMDLPVLVLLFIHFAKSDKGERKVLDELSDEEMDRLNEEHLRLRG